MLERKETEKMMKTAFHKVVLTVALLLAPVVAHADDLSRGFVHLGVADVKLADKGTTYAAGAPLVGATYSTNHTTPLMLEAGYFVTRTLAVQASIGSQETTHNIPGGTLAGYPNLADDHFHIGTLTLACHPWRARTVSPYFGAGLGFHFADGATDGLLSNFKVKNAAGLALQAGVDVKITPRAGFYVDLKKLFYVTPVTGDLGAVPLSASGRLDPVIVQAGVSLRF